MKNGPYELVIAPSEYPGLKYRGRYIYEHHLVWWRNTGELVPDGYLIHHKNENKRDNRFDNFELQKRPEHTALHNSERKPPPIMLICEWCWIPFYKEVRQHRAKIKAGQTSFFCSRSCQVSKQQHDIHHCSVAD